LRTGEFGRGGRGSVAIGTASWAPLLMVSRLSCPNSASNGMVNPPVPLAVDVALSSTLITQRDGGMIGTHLMWVSSNLCITGVLYTHPRVSMDSMRSPHSPHRVLMESMRSPWILEGLHSAFPNSLHGLYGLHGESMESPCGVYEDSTWSPQVHEDSMKQCFMDSTEIIHGLLMDSAWTPHGLQRDCLPYLFN
jgi:hypothetical protein